MLSTIVMFRLVAASQVLLLAVVLYRAGGARRSRLLSLALLLCICCYLLMPLMVNAVHGAAALSALVPAVIVLLDLAASAIPALLFLLAWTLFEDDNKPVPRLAWVLIAAYLLAVLPRQHMLYADGTLWRWLLFDGAQVIKLAVTTWAMWLAWQGRESDLLNSRLRFRYYFCAGLALIVILVVVAELASNYTVPQHIELAGMGAICAAAFLANVWFMRPGRNLSFELPAPAETPAISQPLVDKLRVTMEEQRFYARHELKIGMLAEELGVTEHVLRRTINGTMQQKNFNQFVNQYRIAEAARRLLEEPDLPVLTIALDVGFSSISSFNAAFRLIHQVAPTEFRTRNSN